MKYVVYIAFLGMTLDVFSQMHVHKTNSDLAETSDQMSKDSVKQKRHTIRHLDYSWENKNIKPSPPPPLTGKQMGVINTLGIQPLGYEMDGDVKVFRLIAQPVEQYITDGKVADYDSLIQDTNRLPHEFMHHSPIVQKVRAWGYNGTTPGPTIEVNEGDKVRILVTNELPEPTSIHWHGIEMPVAQDGQAGFTEPPLMPGQTKKYEFTLFQSGTAFYHGELNLMKAVSYGLVGAFVIHPKKYEKPIDKQFVITLQDWRIVPGSVNPDLMSMEFNWFTFNGHAAPTIPKMTVNQGDRVRIRLINMSVENHPIHLHGYTWHVVGTEGGPIKKSAQWPGNTVDIPPGASRDVEFKAWNPGPWFFHCHIVHHVTNNHVSIPMGVMPHGGMFTIFHVIAKDPKAPWKHYKQEKLDSSAHDVAIKKGNHHD